MAIVALILAAILLMIGHVEAAAMHERARKSSLTNTLLLDPTMFTKDAGKKLTLTAGQQLKVVCMDAYAMLCISRLGTEFVDPVSQWDVVAMFLADAQGHLQRTSDKSCMSAVAMDGASWFDLQYVPCNAPSASTWRVVKGRLRTTVAKKEVCLYTEEGYGVVDLCSKVAASNGGVSNINIASASSAVNENKPITAKIKDTMNTVYSGSFWEYAWDISVGRSLAAADVKASVDMRVINDYERSLGECVLECRAKCDSTLWCRAFDFCATTKVCRMTAKPKPVLQTSADTVSFAQNAKYKREDFFLGV